MYFLYSVSFVLADELYL